MSQPTDWNDRDTLTKAGKFTEQIYHLDAKLSNSEQVKTIVLVTDESDTGVIEIKGVDLMGAQEEWFEDYKADVQAFMASSDRLRDFTNQPLTIIK
jgi:hypothetical protein